jgi:hypothetical protein
MQHNHNIMTGEPIVLNLSSETQHKNNVIQFKAHLRLPSREDKHLALAA